MHGYRHLNVLHIITSTIGSAEPLPSQVALRDVSLISAGQGRAWLLHGQTDHQIDQPRSPTPSIPDPVVADRDQGRSSSPTVAGKTGQRVYPAAGPFGTTNFHRRRKGGLGDRQSEVHPGAGRGSTIGTLDWGTTSGVRDVRSARENFFLFRPDRSRSRVEILAPEHHPMDFYSANPELKEVLDQIRSGAAFLPRSPGPLPAPRGPSGFTTTPICSSRITPPCRLPSQAGQWTTPSSIRRQWAQRQSILSTSPAAVISLPTGRSGNTVLGHLEGFVRSHFC